MWLREYVLVLEAVAEGRFRELPLQAKKMQAVLRYVVRAFEPGREYTEKQVNEALARFHNDTSGLRRELVDAGFLRRTTNGSRYWLGAVTPAP